MGVILVLAVFCLSDSFSGVSRGVLRLFRGSVRLGFAQSQVVAAVLERSALERNPRRVDIEGPDLAAPDEDE